MVKTSCGSLQGKLNCNVCKTDFYIKTIRLSAVKSHSMGKKHVKKLKQRKGTVENISNFLKQSGTEEVKVSWSENQHLITLIVMMKKIPVLGLLVSAQMKGGQQK